MAVGKISMGNLTQMVKMVIDNRPVFRRALLNNAEGIIQLDGSDQSYLAIISP